MTRNFIYLFLLFLSSETASEKNEVNDTTLINQNLSKITSLKSQCVDITPENTLPLSKYSNKHTSRYNIREIHNDECGGDPATAPSIAFIEITNQKIFIWHFFCDFVPLDEYSIDMECKE